jgi:hypothetical protein
MPPAGEVAQPGVVPGLVGQGVVVGEDKPSFAGGKQFAVVGGELKVTGVGTLRLGSEIEYRRMREG